MQNWMQVKLQFVLSSSAENMSSFHGKLEELLSSLLFLVSVHGMIDPCLLWQENHLIVQILLRVFKP
jgi:hypothetical protein